MVVNQWNGEDGLPIHPCANPGCGTCDGHGTVLDDDLAVFVFCGDCIDVAPADQLELGVATHG